MAVKKTQMYRRNLDGTETNLNPLTESQYVLMENGQTVQEVLSDRDSDKYTPVITNSSSTFKVGQGDNVDLSSSMKEGAYDSCVLKGKTMVNCIQEPSSKDVVLPYEFADGRYVTINDTKESGALGVELKGQTLVNLVPKKIIDYTASSDWDGYHQLVQNSKQSFDEWRALQDLKPNTKYYISCYVETFEVVNNEGYRLNNPSVESIFEDSMIVNGVGRYQWVSTTKSELTDEIFMALRCQNAYARGTIKIRDIMIIEYQQGMENWDIPYFTGMTSCKMPTLHTVGKNLFNINNPSYTWKSDGNLISTIEENKIKFLGYFSNFKEPYRYEIALKENASYTFSYETFGNLGYEYPEDFCLRIYKDNTLSRTLWRMRGEVGFTLSNGENKVRFDIRLNKEWGEGEIYEIDGGVQNIQLEESSVKTSYEPYKTSILSLPEEVVLRSLPNGVCDTFNTRTGVYTQRIGEVVLDGSHSTRTVASVVNSELYQPYIISGLSNVKNIKETAITVNCDKLITRSARTTSYSAFTDNSIAQYVDPSADFVGVLLKSTLGNLTPQQWFESNPVRVQYELETPVITKINLPSTLKSWNTTTHIYSEIPENTLYPILSHSNPSYPVILKPSTKYSIVANSYSNNHTNSAIKFNLGGATASTTVGNRVTTITTPSTLSNELLTMSGRGNKLNNVMVIEGDVAGDEPYFEGMCDSKSPILSNIGKNLFDANEFKRVFGSNVEIGLDGTIVSLGDIKGGNHNLGFYSPINIALKPNTKYTLCLLNLNTSGQIIRVEGCLSTCNSELSMSNVAINSVGYKVFTTNSQNYKDGVSFKVMTGATTGEKAQYQMMIVEGEVSHETYSPYKSNTTTFNQKDDKTIVLRSLPNGICDTLNVETGEYVQRIGDYTVNGTETSWFTYIDTTGASNNYLNQTSCAFGVHLTGKVKGNGVLCDKLPTRSIGWWADRNTGEGICGIDNDNRIFLRVKNEKTGVLYTDNTSTALEKVKTYLASNPVTVQYELATPIVSTIDVQGFPYAYTNGHVQSSSGHSGQSLTPKVEYSLSANKTGQINSNTKRVSTHQKQLDDFEAMMLTSLVESHYSKTLLEFEYSMRMNFNE